MKFVDMKCSNCGGRMEYADGHYKCAYCGAIMLKIVDAKVDADVERLDAEEFGRKLEESKRSFLIKVEDEIKVLDAKTAIINKRLQNAKKSLSVGKYEAVFTDLEGVSDEIPAAVRLRFLASMKVKDEYGLSLCKKDIRNDWYRKFLFVCEDEETKRSYEKIAEICLLNEKLDKELESELQVIREMMKVGLREEPLTYAKQVCSKYPQLCKSWGEYAAVKCNQDPDYDCTIDIEIMKKCPDYKWDFVPDPVKRRRADIISKQEKSRRETEERKRREALEKEELDKLLRKDLEQYKVSRKKFKGYSLFLDFLLVLVFAGGLMSAYACRAGIDKVGYLLALGMLLVIGGAIMSCFCVGPVAECKKECKTSLSRLEPHYNYGNTVCAEFKNLKKVSLFVSLLCVILALAGIVLLVYGLTIV